MSRSAGVTASAVIAILGSLALGAMGVLLLFSALMVNSRGIPNTPPMPVPATLILGIEAFMFVGFAIFGIVSAVGLLRLKKWARICFIVFAAILAFFAFSSLFGGIIVMAVPHMLPSDPNLPQGFMTGIALMMVAFALTIGALSVWWLIYFNRRKVKAEFMGEVAAALPRRGPLSITVIGWLLVIGAFATLIASLTRNPAIFLGMVIEGWGGAAIYLAFAATSLAAGIGLLKWRRWALPVAMGFYAFGFLNTALSFMTGAFARMNELIQQRMSPVPYPALPSSPVLMLSLIFTVVYSLVIFWILISRRREFIAASA